ncbi:sugar phosphate isomerase/epimerase [Pedobacter sp. MC2016-24]|uniref:sugar phosphate isomerase/epimerase family protein n=1 Tax=Pedobacter sp. MC2016-24 TaxID=2780090 RepID=UPI00187E4BB8|nr:sugar phosphate isomerase/epimerase [Pedobacter sp. MC2016-24]MBE9600280.1 sugar phosphate isomerase/epimerase [Pedobacter sp. MC2016-24]
MNLFRHRFFLPASFLLLLFIGLASCKTRQNQSVSKHPEAKLGWKLGAQAYTFKQFTFSQAIAKIDSCDLSYVEAYPGQEIGAGIPGKMDYKMDAAKRNLILKKLQENHVKMVAYGVVGADNEADWIKIFEFCKAMGVETITSEPNEKYLQLLSDLCDRYQINVAIHNHPNPSHYWNPDIALNAIKGKSKRLGLCADIGHWVRSGLDPVASLKKASGHVLHLHMKDLNEKSRNAHDVHWGEGVCDIDAVIKELKSQNFKGAISAEYEYNWNSNSADVAESVKYFRKSFNQP